MLMLYSYLSFVVEAVGEFCYGNVKMLKWYSILR